MGSEGRNCTAPPFALHTECVNLNTEQADYLRADIRRTPHGVREFKLSANRRETECVALHTERVN